MNIGDRVQQYEILASLGAGHLGQMYRARDVNAAREVALRVLPLMVVEGAGSPPLSGTGERLTPTRTEPARWFVFQKAVQSMARLQHANIQQVYEAGRDTAQSVEYVAFEYLPGGSLQQRLEKGLLPLAEALATFTSICAAVNFAHRQGVVHLSLRPANILYDAAGRLVVSDFDLLALGGETARAPADQKSAGRAYAAPEQVRGETGDARSDVYSLGVMLFELVTGQQPSKGVQLRRAKRWGTLPVELVSGQFTMLDWPDKLPPLRPSDLNSAVPAHVDEAVLRAMRKLPAERFQSVWEMACVVNQQPYVPQVEVVPPPPPPPPPPPVQPAVLRVLTGAQAGQWFALSRDMTSMGGKKGQNDIMVDDPYASRAHARIERQGTRYVLTDLNSANGTKINEQRMTPLAPVPLSPGDKIEIGYTLFQFELG